MSLCGCSRKERKYLNRILLSGKSESNSLQITQLKVSGGSLLAAKRDECRYVRWNLRQNQLFPAIYILSHKQQKDGEASVIVPWQLPTLKFILLLAPNLIVWLDYSLPLFFLKLFSFAYTKCGCSIWHKVCHTWASDTVTLIRQKL